MENMDLVKAIGYAALDKKANRLIVQDLRNRSDLCDYQVICSAANERQTLAICDSIEVYLKRNANLRPVAIEGKQSSHWILMDYGPVMVHIFLEELRDYYALENLWPDVAPMSIKPKTESSV
ncbi:MAG: ribosome silencing factor [Pseudobacteriovorax sp.]|nr:ribosome silencing factor [Pseudobacteriovorax sp.]